MSDLLKKTLTLSDAVKITKPLRFNMMFKPIGSICNMNCSYCYYLDKINMYDKMYKMSYGTLEKCIKEYIETNDGDDVTFDWHGGEPLLLGLDYFVEIVRLQNKYRGSKRIFNTIQTNATLLDHKFASFFRDFNFLVGVSVDGPQDIHDKYRRYRNLNPTFDGVMRGLELLHRYDVEFNTLTTISKAGEGRGLDVYSFLKSVGSRFMQFMPVYEYVDGRNNRIVSPEDNGSCVASWSVDPLRYGEFMCDIFDCWVRNDVGEFYVSLFDATLANWCGVNPGICVYSETCGANAVVEHNGDIFPCDHFVYAKYKLGNINSSSLNDIVNSGKISEFGIGKRNFLPDKCRKCKYFFACHGECPKHRFDVTSMGEHGLNSLCDGLFYFFSHVEPYMNIMRDLLSQNKAPKDIMAALIKPQHGMVNQS